MPLRPRRMSVRPQDLPIYLNPVNMDFEKRRLIGELASISSLSSRVRCTIHFANPNNIDGGDLGESASALVPAIIRDVYDDLTGAMDYMYTNLDGGIM